MGNFMGMPSSTQVAFPPPPFPMPVSRPPIIPPMRQLDVGLGPPSPFQPGRTPLPVVLPSLATRPPLLQQDGNIQVGGNYFAPGGMAGQAPIDNIITANEMNKQIVTQKQNIVTQPNNLNQPQQFVNELQNQNYPINQQTTVYQTVVQPNVLNQNSNLQNLQQEVIYQNQIQVEPTFQQPQQYPSQAPLQQIFSQQIYQPQQTNQIDMNAFQTYEQNPFGNFSSSNIPQNSTIFMPAIPQIPNHIPNQPPLIQEIMVVNQPVSANPQPAMSYAKLVNSVPIIPTRVLETVNELKQSRQILQDAALRGVQLAPYYIPEKQAYYQGQWINGLPGGYARIFYDSGAYFEGYFVNGQAFCKQGIWVYPDGSYYMGGIAHSAPNGLGQLTYRGSGMKYIGNWVNGKPHGQGREEFKDGSFFEGTFVNGIKQGIGKFIWADGSFYEGQFKNGFMQGHGVKQFSNGSKFIGEFKRNRLYGKGTYLFDRGQYKGEFVDNKRQGMGIFKYSDGRIYTGQFKQDRQDGRGRMFVPTGQVIDGQWSNGKNIAIHNISQSTSISDISLDDLTFNNTTQVQIPNVPLTVSLEAMNSIPISPPAPNGSNIQTNFYYSANYRPPQAQNSIIHQ